MTDVALGVTGEVNACPTAAGTPSKGNTGKSEIYL